MSRFDEVIPTEDDISKNGRIGIFSFDNTSAPSEMLEILTDIENKEYDK